MTENILEESEESIEQITRRLDYLVQIFEQHPDEQVRDRVMELLALVDALHRQGLGRLVESLPADRYETLLQDPVVNTLLTLYDLAPVEPLVQVEMALDTARSYLSAHGGAVEVLKVEEGVVHLRLSGSCNGCSASAVTLKRVIETALKDGFEAFQSIEVHEPAQPSTKRFLPMVSSNQAAALKRPVFTLVGPLEDIPPGTLKAVELEGARILLCNVENEIYAYQNVCPDSLLPLSSGHLEGVKLHCPWHNCVYDARTGKRLDGINLSGLAVIPVAVRNGEIQLALNVAPVAAGH